MRAEILHTGAVNGRGVRFVMPPTEGPALPWLVFGDLTKAAGIPRKARPQQAKITREHWPEESATVRLGRGRELIVSRAVAQAFMFGLMKNDFTTQEVLNDCAHAEAGATELMFARLSLSLEEQTRWHFQTTMGGVPMFELHGDQISVDLEDLERITGTPAAELQRDLQQSQPLANLRLVARKDVQ